MSTYFFFAHRIAIYVFILLNDYFVIAIILNAAYFESTNISQKVFYLHLSVMFRILVSKRDL